MIYAGTGHRPPRLGLGYDPASRNRLECFVVDYLKFLGDAEEVWNGGANGFDQALGVACYKLGIPYNVAVPFEGQEAKWPPEVQDWYRYEFLARAKKVFVVSPGKYENWKFTRRDQFMVDVCDKLLALKDDKPEKSGTGITVAYAQKKGVPVLNLWEEWVKVV